MIEGIPLYNCLEYGAFLSLVEENVPQLTFLTSGAQRLKFVFSPPTSFLEWCLITNVNLNTQNQNVIFVSEMIQWIVLKVCNTFKILFKGNY